MSKTIVGRSPVLRLLQLATSLFVFLAASALHAQTGRLSGTVTSQSTGNALQGATVTLANGKSTLTDESGRFTFFDVPAGTVSVSAAYSGFNDKSAEVALTAGGSQEVSLTLASSDIVQLEAFTVSTV